MKNYITLFLVFIVTTTSMQSQNDGIETFLLAKNDSEKLLEAYLSPAMKGLIFDMNSGWHHTAKVHKKFGFDITIGASASFVPSKDEVFNLMDLNLSNNTSFNQNTSATVLGGSSTTTITYTSTVQGQTAETTFALPEGIKDDLPANAVPLPIIQVGVGLPWDLETNIRYVPTINQDDIKLKFFGLGFKKEITKWFGPLDKLPLHVSLLAAYTGLSVDYNIQNDSDLSGFNQRAEFKMKAFNFEALASLNFPFINIFGAVGYNAGNSKLGLLGSYDLDYTLSGTNTIVSETVTDPLSLKYNAKGFKTTLGTRISLGFFKIFGSYTLQKYNVANVGLAFSFR